MKTRPNLNKGFTLIELLVVIAIIGTLSTVVLTSLNQARAKARDSQRVQNILALKNALEIYYTENGYVYPTVGSVVARWGNGCGSVTPGSENSSWLPATYMASLPTDPQDFCYLYSSNGTDYKLSFLNATEVICEAGETTPPCYEETIWGTTYDHTLSIFTPGGEAIHLGDD